MLIISGRKDPTLFSPKDRAWNEFCRSDLILDYKERGFTLFSWEKETASFISSTVYREYTSSKRADAMSRVRNKINKRV